MIFPQKPPARTVFIYKEPLVEQSPQLGKSSPKQRQLMMETEKMIKVFLSKNPFMVFGVDIDNYFMRMAALGWTQESFSKVYSAIVTEWESYGDAASRKAGSPVFFTVGVGEHSHASEGMRIQKLRSLQHPDNIGVALVVDLTRIPGQDAPKQGGVVEYWEAHWKKQLQLQKAEATRLLDESKRNGRSIV